MCCGVSVHWVLQYLTQVLDPLLQRRLVVRSLRDAKVYLCTRGGESEEPQSRYSNSLSPGLIPRGESSYLSACAASPLLSHLERTPAQEVAAHGDAVQFGGARDVLGHVELVAQQHAPEHLCASEWS